MTKFQKSNNNFINVGVAEQNLTGVATGLGLLGKKAIKTFKPMHKADVKETYSDIKLIREWIDYKPKVSLEEGLAQFAEWYLNYHRSL